jgi:hypothetical protein
VFRLRGTETLMELPFSIMDTALFYPSRMGLAPDEALAQCRQIVANARRFGGTVVVNWHDRSLAPERLWGAFYGELLKEIGDKNRVWFTTAERAVDWFRWRRSIRFDANGDFSGTTITAVSPLPAGPAAVVRVYRPDGGFDERRVGGGEIVRLEL